MPAIETITVGIWHYGAIDRLVQSLTSLRRSTLQAVNLLLLLDGPVANLRPTLANWPDAAHWLSPTPIGAPGCFNRLIHHDHADLVIFLESGSLVTPGWLDLLLAAFAADERHGLAGPSTNRAWDDQCLPSAPTPTATVEQIAAYATQAKRRYGHQQRSLAPLHSLSDFCYAVRRPVIETIGAADEGYGRGPCWEMDYSVRAARAGFTGVWVCGAYVHRRAPLPERTQAEKRLFAANRLRYQDKFCALQLTEARTTYCHHCEGEACEHFAPRAWIQLALPPAAQTPTVAAPLSPSPVQPITVSPAERQPLVSCIMPTYNRRAFVRQAIHYFQRQDYPNRELIIIDDGTEAVVDLMPDAPNIRYIRLTEKQSIGAKRNLGGQHASGEIMVHWDDDDWHAPWRLSYQVNALLETGAALCGFDQIHFFDPRRAAGWLYCYPPTARRWVCGGTLAYTRRLWQQYPFADINIGEDTRFVWQVNADQILVLPNNHSYVALVHPNNTSEKRTSGNYWRPIAVETIQELLGADLTFYAKGATPQPSLPLVSCIMPTYNRPHFVPQAIRYFLAQEYPNRELLILDDGDPIEALLPTQEPAIRYLRLPQKTDLGTKRNLACEAARGEILIGWDDDDWYGCERIRAQVAPLLADEADVTGLENTLLLNVQDGSWWSCSPVLHNRMFYQGVISGTLAFRKTIWHTHARFPARGVGEDALFHQQLHRSRARTVKVSNNGLFIYVRHGANSWRFQTGRFLQASGWLHAKQPAFIPQADLDFYRSLRMQQTDGASLQQRQQD